MCRRTNFADAFTHLSEGRARVEDLHVSVCAVLLAEARNISFADVAHPGVPALTYARLSWVSQNYVRAETIAAANELLLKVHARIPLVEALGDGHIATVDGMRLPVPVRSIHAGPNPRYFDTGRGVTWLNYMSDQFAGLHAIVVPGTLHDSLVTLDGLLELQPARHRRPVDDHHRAGLLLRPGLRPVLAAGLPVQPAAPRRAVRSALLVPRGHADYGPLSGVYGIAARCSRIASTGCG